jgi:hypothetical protein
MIFIHMTEMILLRSYSPTGRWSGVRSSNLVRTFLFWEGGSAQS